MLKVNLLIYGEKSSRIFIFVFVFLKFSKEINSSTPTSENMQKANAVKAQYTTFKK